AFGWQVAQLRAAAEPLGELEPRLLRVVLQALQRDLESLQAHHRALYGHVHDSGFWREKTDEFLAVARRVIAERVASGAHQLHAAEYLWHGLQVRDEATAVLLRAEKRGVLPEHGRFR